MENEMSIFTESEEEIENKIYTLTIEGQNRSFTVDKLTMNGSNYVSETEVDTSAWPQTFRFTATDEEGNVAEQYDHAKLVQQVSYDWDGGKWYLAFATVSQQEIENAKVRSQVEYLAMMTDIELEG